MTLGELKDAAGMKRGFLRRSPQRSSADFEKEDARLKRIEDEAESQMVDTGGVIICGSFDADVCHACGYLGENLCDYPIGKGKTCDLPMCDEHATEIGTDKHLCAIHFTEWVAKTRTDRINEWPPKRPKSGR